MRLLLLAGTLSLAGCFASADTPLVSTLQAKSLPAPAHDELRQEAARETPANHPDLQALSLEPDNCQLPSNNYSLITVNGHTLNQRTVEMLEHAYALYQGPIDIRGPAITQGSHTSSEPGSYGTHAGGGAVDIRVYDVSGERWVLLADEIEPLIRALRTAGFAAWYRPSDYLSPGSAAHIHAIAIGDQTLSTEARAQLDGRCGYFNGYAGLPLPKSACDAGADPWPDIHRGPLVCNWMCELPYAGLAGELTCKPNFKIED